METMIIIGLIAVLGVMFWSMSREKKLVGFYSQINVCGSWYAFFTGYCLLIAVACPIMAVVTALQIKNDGGEAGEIISTILLIVAVCAAVCLLGWYLYHRAAKRCPENLRKRMLWDIIVIAIGRTTRISLIFMMFIVKTWWLFEKPSVYEVNGRTVYAYPGSAELYDEYGMHVGRLSDFGGTAVMD